MTGTTPENPDIPAVEEVQEAPHAPTEDSEVSRFDQVDERVGFFSGGPLAVLARLGSARVFIVLALIWIIFQTQNSNFLSAFNLTNLVLQISAVGLISIGITLILLLGEIDLSVGAVSGLCAAIMAVLQVKHGWSPYLAIAAALAAGAAIGLLNGFFVTQFGIPSFVVTLAGLLAWQGALLKVLGDTGTLNLNDAKITGLTDTFYGKGFAGVVAAIMIVLFGLSGLRERRLRTKAGLAPPSMASFIGRWIAVAGGTIGAVLILTSDRGVPLAGLILVGFCALFVFITERTVWGRHVYAVGGNDEASRRAGIPVRRVRMMVFMLASMFAAAGGVMAASRLQAVNQSSGGSDLLLLAIAGPVIAGTSLFGGRGSVWGALLGALVIGSISNGMDLLGLQSSDKFMITGGVLLAAVVLDAVIRNEREKLGARR